MQVSLRWFKTLISPGSFLLEIDCTGQRAPLAFVRRGREDQAGSLREFQATPAVSGRRPRIDLGDDEYPRGLVPQQMAWIDLLEAISLASSLAVAETLRATRNR
jgi:hypothetical protein